MDKHRYRKQWLLLFRKKLGSTKALAERLEADANNLSAILGPRGSKNVGDELAARVETKFDLPPGTLDLPSKATHKLIAASDGLNEQDIDGVIAYIGLLKAQKIPQPEPAPSKSVKTRKRETART